MRLLLEVVVSIDVPALLLLLLRWMGTFTSTTSAWILDLLREVIV